LGFKSSLYFLGIFSLILWLSFTWGCPLKYKGFNFKFSSPTFFFCYLCFRCPLLTHKDIAQSKVMKMYA
jgi:hypothetical protein